MGERLLKIPQIDINPNEYATNIIFFSLQNTKHTAKSFVDALMLSNIRMLAIDNKIRAILHMDISTEGVHETVETIKKIFR